MKKTLGVLVLIAALAAAGCGAGKPAAEAALGAAQTAFDATKEQANKIAPEQAKAVQDALDAVKADIDKGDFKTAIESAKAIPAQVATLKDGLAAKQAELQQSWDGMKDMGAVVDQFKGKVESLAAAKKLPAGIDAGKLDAAKAALAEVTAKWGEAQTAMQAGNWAEAVTKGGEVKTALENGMAAIGMKMPAMPAAAPAEAAPAK